MPHTGQRLTWQERAGVACYCTHLGAGWVMDPDKRHAVCSHCGNPSPLTVLRICNECDDQFVIDPESPKWRSRFHVTRENVVYENEFFCTNCVPE